MAVHVKRNLVMVLPALLAAAGIACAPAHTAWARQDLRPAVASDPGDGVLGDPADALGGDPYDGSDVDPNSGEDAGAFGWTRDIARSREDALCIAGDPGDGDGSILGVEWLGTIMHWLFATIAGVTR